MIIETVQDLIDELRRHDPKARVGMEAVRRRFNEERQQDDVAREDAPVGGVARNGGGAVIEVLVKAP